MHSNYLKTAITLALLGSAVMAQAEDEPKKSAIPGLPEGTTLDPRVQRRVGFLRLQQLAVRHLARRKSPWTSRTTGWRDTSRAASADRTGCQAAVRSTA